MNCIKKLWKDERGMGIIEIAIIIVIIIALALIFKEQVMNLIDTLFNKVDLSVQGI